MSCSGLELCRCLQCPVCHTRGSRTPSQCWSTDNLSSHCPSAHSRTVSLCDKREHLCIKANIYCCVKQRFYATLLFGYDDSVKCAGLNILHTIKLRESFVVSGSKVDAYYDNIRGYNMQ